ncbi:MAG: FimB/Mfa2 family fimbrial subunit [Muribaculaceae bacterium]|nr:FimB/Mfa2 family fimbrial subunit [Muribaculaceae bacterium]
MKTSIQSFRNLAIALLAIASAGALSSCGSVFDDLPECPTGAGIRFVYDYNLESANAFPSQVDCLTLHLYDGNGNFIRTVNETSSVLADENWRMNLDLPAGNYHAVVYGGIACDKASFSHLAEPAPGSHYSDITMALVPEHIGKRLHDHFHGVADFTVTDDTPELTDVTVHLKKTTNHFRILLQHIDGTPVDGRDFDFRIDDDNSRLDHLNNPVSGFPVSYTHTARGAASTSDPDEIFPSSDAQAANSGAQAPLARVANSGSRAPISSVTVGYGEISTSRLHLNNNPELVISLTGGGEVVRLPLKFYLLRTLGEGEPWSDQEYLDRCSRWNMTFLLDHNNKWADTRIIINGWTVRINNIDK